MKDVSHFSFIVMFVLVLAMIIPFSTASITLNTISTTSKKWMAASEFLEKLSAIKEE